MMTAKSSKWHPTQPRNAFFLFGLKIMTDMIALLMMILSSLENSGALPRLTQTTITHGKEVSGVIVDKTATLKKMLKVGPQNCK